MEKRKKTVLLMAPFALFPFCSLLFYALGGGAVKAETISQVQRGINAELPVPSQSQEGEEKDKLRFYEAAAEDSLTAQQQSSMDPYARNHESFAVQENASRQKIAEIEGLMRASPGTSSRGPSYNEVKSEAIPRKSEAESDPEIERLNQMMDKILDIQHPDRVATTVKNEEKEETYFYGAEEIQMQGWKAKVAETQKVTEGSTVKLELQENLPLEGMQVTAGSFVYGLASFNGDRLEVSVPSLRSTSGIVKISFAVYDADGLRGIAVPGSAGRSSVKNDAASSIGSVNLGSFDPSIKGQVASAGIEAAKNLLGRKTRTVWVTLKAGHQVSLLKMQ